MVGSASVALSGKAILGSGMSGVRLSDSPPFVVEGRVREGFFDLSRSLSVACFPCVGNIENLRSKKNLSGLAKNCGFCLLGNNFNIIFAKINKLNHTD